MIARRPALLGRDQAAPFLKALAALLTLALTPAWAQTAPPEGSGALAQLAHMRPGDMQTGALLLQSKEPGQLVQAPRLNTDVNITINGPIARAVVTQRFQNPGREWVEGIYVFPLPEDAAVDSLRMRIGSREIEGRIKPRAEAREIYEQARDAGYEASLIEQERPNIFTNSVANIGPRETVVVTIEYQETLQLDSGIYSLRFPLVVAPRYSPEPPELSLVRMDGNAPKDPVPDRERITPPVFHPDAGKVNPVSLQISIKAGFALGEIKSHHHEIRLERTGDDTAILALVEGEVPADKDFELTWSPKPVAAPQATLFRERIAGSDYLLVMVTPPTEQNAPQSIPREVIFVIDNSGSMAGESIVQAKQSLLFALQTLRPDDRFNVIRFDDRLELLFDQAVDASPENLAIARHFVSRLEAEGGTEMLPALKAALRDPTPSDTTRLRQIVFLTDGAIGNEAQLFEEIADGLGRSRVFTIGIGSAPNSYFMRRAAELGRGTFTMIGSEDQVLERMKALFAKLERPAMIRLKAEWPSGTAAETGPNPLPDLYAGEPLVISAKAATLSGELRLSGELDGKAWSQTLPLSTAAEGSGVAKLWARGKIASLEAQRYAELDVGATDKAIETVALEHHLVSSQTSLVAVELSKSRPDGETVTRTEVPLNLPSGWEYDKVFGPPSPVPMQQAMPSAPSRSAGYSGYYPASPAPLLALNGSEAGASMRGLNAYTTAAEDRAQSSVAPDTATVPDSEPYDLAQSDQTAGPAAEPAGSVQAPQTATHADRAQQIGAALLLLLAALVVVALGLWRHHRRAYASPRRVWRRI